MSDIKCLWNYEDKENDFCTNKSSTYFGELNKSNCRKCVHLCKMQEENNSSITVSINDLKKMESTKLCEIIANATIELNFRNELISDN